MSADKKSIFVWSPFISKVGTVQNVINSLNSINKYSNLNTNLINVFGEWDNYKALFSHDKFLIHNFKFLRNTTYLSLNNNIKAKIIEKNEDFILSEKDGMYLPNNTNFIIENMNDYESSIIFCEGL